MKILHTSDWHVGRTFHGESTLEALEQVFDALIELIECHKVDVVVVSGDIFDSSTPAGEFVSMLDATVFRILATDAHLVMTSGNHDSPRRLGFNSGPAAFGGVHIITQLEQSWVPVILSARHDPQDTVAFYGIPYLEPRLVRDFDGEDKFTSHEAVLQKVMSKINEDRATREMPSVVLAHCFAAGTKSSNQVVDPVDGEVEQYEGAVDITAGGLGIVPLDIFDGPDYVALGHIHGRNRLSEAIRYSGAPLHYSFSEAGKPRGAWLLTIDGNGLGEVEWLDLPVPRPLVQLKGTLADLLENPEYSQHESSWVKAIVTDQAVPLDPMNKLRKRFPHVAVLEKQPEGGGASTGKSYSAQVLGKTDEELVENFFSHVRNGKSPDSEEKIIIRDVIAAIRESGVEQ